MLRTDVVMNSRGVHASLARAAWSRWSLTNQQAPEHLDSGPAAAIAVCAQMHVSICMRSVREQDETRSMFRSRRLARPVAGLRAVQRQLKPHVDVCSSRLQTAYTSGACVQ